MPATALRDPNAGADRRGTLRHPVRMAGLLSRPEAAAVSVEVIDISETGCQIVRPEALGRDAALLLSFGGFAPFEASVVWTSPKAAGLRFAYPVHPALIAQVVSAAKGRRRPRRLLSPALIRREERERLWHLAIEVGFEEAAAPASGRERWTGTLSDLSVDGCRIVSDAEVPEGTGLLVHIGGESPMLGEARWCAEGAIGIEFGAPLPPGMAERIAQAQR